MAYATKLDKLPVSNCYSASPQVVIANDAIYFGLHSLHPWASCQIRKIAGAHAPGMPGPFFPSPQLNDPDMHHGTCVTHVPWCMPGSLTSGFLCNRRRGKRSRHSRRMRNLQFYVSGKRPIEFWHQVTPLPNTDVFLKCKASVTYEMWLCVTKGDIRFPKLNFECPPVTVKMINSYYVLKKNQHWIFRKHNHTHLRHTGVSQNKDKIGISNARSA